MRFRLILRLATALGLAFAILPVKLTHAQFIELPPLAKARDANGNGFIRPCELASELIFSIHPKIHGSKRPALPFKGTNFRHIRIIYHPIFRRFMGCLLYTSPSPRDATLSRMPSSA